MSMLDKLLKGVNVEWKLLADISEIYGGLKGKSKKDFTDGNAKYVSYKNIFYNIEVDYDKLYAVKVESDENQFEVKYGDVLFTGSSEIAKEVGMSSAVTNKSNVKVYLNSFSFGLRFNQDIELMPEFSKYLFRSYFMRNAIVKTANGVTRFNVSKKSFKKLRIPIPPLKIQQEIVRILDTFTELTAELTARKKQYKYYREQLLTFDKIEIQHVPMGDENIGKFVRGSGLQKKDFTEKGVGCIHYGQVYTHYGTYTTKTKSFVSEEFAKKARKAEYGDLIIATTSENDEDLCKAVAWLGNEEIAVSSDACFYKHKLNPKYVAYFFQTEQFHKQKRPFITGAKVRRVNADNLANIKIPVPSKKEQERIVNILDKFDVLTTSISEGLPKEIALRKKQYEYYRNKLLAFPKDTVEVKYMSQSLTEIAQALKKSTKKVQLIYAFNGTGKTRLSRKFRLLVDPKIKEKIKVMYYNAFTEDLFYWDNDLDTDTNRKLIIRPSNFTNLVLEFLKDQGLDNNIVNHFQHFTSDSITPLFNEDFSEVTFSLTSGDDQSEDNIKISKGEESNFIWCVYYSLIEQVVELLNIPKLEERASNQFDNLEYIFIDDPVSSLDDTHLIELAVNISELIKSSQSKIKFIITTHNPLFYNVIYNELNNKDSRYNYKPEFEKYLLEKFDDGTLRLNDKLNDSPFAYHMHLLSILKKVAVSNNIEKYHFNLLRNILEKTATFLGHKHWGNLITNTVLGDKEPYVKRILNISSHSKHSGEETTILTTGDKLMFKRLVKEISSTYQFNISTE